MVVYFLLLHFISIHIQSGISRGSAVAWLGAWMPNNVYRCIRTRAHIHTHAPILFLKRSRRKKKEKLIKGNKFPVHLIWTCCKLYTYVSRYNVKAAMQYFCLFLLFIFISNAFFPFFFSWIIWFAYSCLHSELTTNPLLCTASKTKTNQS